MVNGNVDKYAHLSFEEVSLEDILSVHYYDPHPLFSGSNICKLFFNHVFTLENV